MATQMIVRIEPKLKATVTSLAKAEGKSVSQVVRELLEEYVRNRDIGSYVDNLWERIGTTLTSGGMAARDVPRAIKQVRAKK